MNAHKDESDFANNASNHIENTEVSHIMNKNRIKLDALEKVSGPNYLEHLPIVPNESAFKLSAAKGFLEKGSSLVEKSSFLDKSQPNFLNNLGEQDNSKFLVSDTRSYLGSVDPVKADLIEEHTAEHFFEDHADEKITDLLHVCDDGAHCMADHFEEVGEPDQECHFDEENDIEYIVHELMD